MYTHFAVLNLCKFIAIDIETVCVCVCMIGNGKIQHIQKTGGWWS